MPAEINPRDSMTYGRGPNRPGHGRLWHPLPRSLTAAATLTPTEGPIKADATTAAFTITMPGAAQVLQNTIFYVIKIDSSANVVTVDGAGAETINGAATYSLSAQWKYVALLSDGSNWLVFANN